MKLYDYRPSGNGYKVRLALALLNRPGLPDSLLLRDRLERPGWPELVFQQQVLRELVVPRQPQPARVLRGCTG